MRFDCFLPVLCGVAVALAFVVDKQDRDVVMRAIYELATSAPIQHALALLRGVARLLMQQLLADRWPH